MKKNRIKDTNETALVFSGGFNSIQEQKYYRH